MKSKILLISMLIFSLSFLTFQTTEAQSKSDTTKVLFTTSFGDLTILLYQHEAPITVKNFLAYVDSGFYNGTIFHRVIPGFVIQGGGFDAKMRRRPTYAPIKNESDNGMRNERGTLSMARTSDPNSATSQFFINLVDNRSLDYAGRGAGYAVFGKVIKGMDVVDKIAKVETETRDMYQNVPKKPVYVISAKRLN
jgi:peptidyl-prolyl cis-trans isomerase A (cyclophilin A)